MNNALAPALDHFINDPVAEHLSGVLTDFVSEKVGVRDGPDSKIIRLLAAAPDTPVVMALSEHLYDLALQGFDFRFVFAENAPSAAAENLTLTLERARGGLSGQDGVLRLIGGPAARKVNESLVLGDRLAWIGAPVPHKWEAQTDFGRTIQRPSAVHLAAMGFESVRVGSMPWQVSADEARASTSTRTVIQSLFDWRTGESR